MDAEAHKIYCSGSRPCICCCQMTHNEYDWLDQFEDEPLLGCLFGNEECEGYKVCRLNGSHAGMTIARGTTHEDTVDHPDGIALPCECKLSNSHPQESFQLVLVVVPTVFVAPVVIKQASTNFRIVQMLALNQKTETEIGWKFPKKLFALSKRKIRL